MVRQEERPAGVLWYCIHYAYPGMNKFIPRIDYAGNGSRKLEISTALTKAKSREPAVVV